MVPLGSYKKDEEILKKPIESSEPKGAPTPNTFEMRTFKGVGLCCSLHSGWERHGDATTKFSGRHEVGSDEEKAVIVYANH